MATTLSRIVAKIASADTETSFYTVPANTTIVVIGLRASNANTTGQSINYAVRLKIDGGTAQEIKGNYTGEDGPLPYGSADAVTAGEKFILLEGDELLAECSHADSLSLVMSFAELT